MTTRSTHRTLLATFAVFAMAMAALPAYAACCEASCCPVEIVDHGCECCMLSDCGIEDLGFAVAGSGLALTEPVAEVAPLALDLDTGPAHALPADQIVPPILASLTTTVLRI
jgi:hypothetical protein